MLTTKTLAAAIATLATLSVNVHAELQTNPLHPAYYAERTTVTFQYLPTEAYYVDARNPLHPTFAKTTFRNEWMITAAGEGKAFVDDRNPLHPAFKRF